MHADTQALVDLAIKKDIDGIRAIVRKHYGAGAALKKILQKNGAIVFAIETKRGKAVSFVIPLEWEGMAA
jgi:hypothetical protein